MDPHSITQLNSKVYNSINKQFVPDWSEYYLRIILWSLTAIFGICSLHTFISGHGAALIAGYNTMTEDEKETIDEKNCFVMGMLISALVLFFMKYAWIKI